MTKELIAVVVLTCCLPWPSAGVGIVNGDFEAGCAPWMVAAPGLQPAGRDIPTRKLIVTGFTPGFPPIPIFTHVFVIGDVWGDPGIGWEAAQLGQIFDCTPPVDEDMWCTVSFNARFIVPAGTAETATITLLNALGTTQGTIPAGPAAGFGSYKLSKLGCLDPTVVVFGVTSNPGDANGISSRLIIDNVTCACTTNNQSNIPSTNLPPRSPGLTSVPVDDPVPTFLVEPGLDLFSTPPGGATYQEFSGTPLPAGFFGPGSLPFTGRVDFQGVPLGPVSNAFEFVDTIVERLEVALVPIGGNDTIPIQIRALSLESSAPITVTNGAGGTESWNVRACLSSAASQEQGTMTIYGDASSLGGTFTASLPVRPRLTFTRPSDGAVRVLDLGALSGRPSIVFETTRGHWLNGDPGGLGLVTVAPGETVDHDCNPATPATVLKSGSSSNFFPGLRYDCCREGTTNGAVRKRMTQEEALLAAHGILVAQKLNVECLQNPQRCDDDLDGIPNDADNAPSVANPRQQDYDDDGVGDVADNCPNLPNPFQEDSDMDGVGNVCAGPHQTTFQISPGFTLIANPYRTGLNRIGEVLPNVPEETTLFGWDEQQQAFAPPDMFLFGDGWLNSIDGSPSMTFMPPGEGFALQNPDGRFHLMFSGQFHPPATRQRLPDQFALVGSGVPFPRGFEDVFGFRPIAGDHVYFLRAGAGLPLDLADCCDIHTYGRLGWDTVPIWPAGYAAFVFLQDAAARRETQTFCISGTSQESTWQFRLSAGGSERTGRASWAAGLNATEMAGYFARFVNSVPGYSARQVPEIQGGNPVLTPYFTVTGPAGFTLSVNTGVGTPFRQVTGSSEPVPFNPTILEVRFRIERVGGDVRLSWIGPGNLEEADEVTGPWTPNLAATSPYRVRASAVRKFYRLRLE